MKLLSQVLVLVITFGIVSICNAAGSGPNNGGGGYAALLSDSSVILADPLMNLKGDQPNDGPPQRSLNPRILHAALLVYQAIYDILSPIVPGQSAVLSEIAKLTNRESKIRIFAVQNLQELKDNCATGSTQTFDYTRPLPPYVDPTSARVDAKSGGKKLTVKAIGRVACAAGDDIFIIEPTAKQMSIGQTVLLMVHERLTTIRNALGGRNYAAISNFTTGLGYFLYVFGQQQAGKNEQLTSETLERLKQFYISYEEIERRDSNVTPDSFLWAIHPNGGGRVRAQSVVDPTAYIDVASAIGKKVKVGYQASLQSTLLTDDTVTIDIGRRSSLSYVKMNRLGNGSREEVRISEGLNLKNTQLVGSNFLQFAADSLVENSLFIEAYFRGQANVKISNSRFERVHFANVIGNIEFERMKINNVQLKLLSDNVISDAIIDGSSLVYANYYPINDAPSLGNIKVQAQITSFTKEIYFHRGRNTYARRKLVETYPHRFLSEGQIEIVGEDSASKGWSDMGTYNFYGGYITLTASPRSYVPLSSVAASNEYMIDSKGAIVRPGLTKYMHVYLFQSEVAEKALEALRSRAGELGLKTNMCGIPGCSFTVEFPFEKSAEK